MSRRPRLGSSPDELPDRAEYRARWSALHGGYDPAATLAVKGWLTAVELVARPLARRGVEPDLVTAAGVVAAAVAVPAGLHDGRWHLFASAAVLGSGVADSLDGALAVLTDQATPWGYVVDSLADRVSDAAYLMTLARAGAPRWLAMAAAGGIATLEYARARAGSAGFGEIGIVTVGERPTRIIVTAAGLAVAGLVPRRSRSIAAATTAAVGVISAVGAGQFLRVAARALDGASGRADEPRDGARR
jgi:phosphatidylglycerophosphate synthase